MSSLDELINETGNIKFSTEEKELIFSKLFESSLSDFIIELDDKSDITFNTNTNSIENQYNELRLKQIERDFTQKLKLFILEEPFEYGFENKADKLVLENLEINRIATKEWINKIYLNNYSNSEYTIGILRLVSRLKIEEISPQGPTMAIAALSHKDEEIQETAIRAFENWSSLEHIDILKSVKVKSEWLADYLNSVIKNIEIEYGIIS